jgi:hypothetical protein
LSIIQLPFSITKCQTLISIRNFCIAVCVGGRKLPSLRLGREVVEMLLRYTSRCLVAGGVTPAPYVDANGVVLTPAGAAQLLARLPPHVHPLVRALRSGPQLPALPHQIRPSSLPPDSVCAGAGQNSKSASGLAKRDSGWRYISGFPVNSAFLGAGPPRHQNTSQ